MFDLRTNDIVYPQSHIVLDIFIKLTSSFTSLTSSHTTW